MRQRSMIVLSALVAAVGGASSAFAASQNFPLGNLAVGAIPGGVSNNALGTLPFNPTRAQFSTNWVAGGGTPWSNEAIWAVADGPLNTAVDFYFDPGASPNSASNGNAVLLTWDVYRTGYDPLLNAAGVPLTFIAGQTFGGSNATWNNSSLTLSDDVAALPQNIIDLGTVANEFQPFVLDTIGSSFDTELAFFNSVGGLAETNDDIGGGNLQSQLNVPGLPAGTYIINVGGFNTTYGAGGYGAVSAPTSAGGNYLINLDGSNIFGGTLGVGTNQFFSVTVVPAPGALALLGLGGLAGLRRRR